MVLLCGLLASSAGWPQEKMLSADEIIAGADARIEKFRKADVVIRVQDADGQPVPAATVKVLQTRHRFLFGCNIYALHRYQGEQQETYGRQFAALFNYATLPFYWKSYEPTPGETLAEDRLRIARWCKERGITTKGHPLVWHETYPAWGPSDADATRAQMKQRVSDIVSRFSGDIDSWDVVNEATVAQRYDSGVASWVKRDGATAVVGECLEWARASNPKAVLLYNDYNVSAEFEKLSSDLVSEGKPLDAIGIQSHMHTGEWTLEHVWQVCQTYTRFGRPLHFTELTVLSGEHGWLRPKPWPTTPEGETRQADYVAGLYKLLFSHPSVEAITWWDFMDAGWQGAPGGLIREDLAPKPVYDRLMELIKTRWWTVAELTTDQQGECRTSGFLGNYKVAVSTPGSSAENEFELSPGTNDWTFRVAGPRTELTDSK